MFVIGYSFCYIFFFIIHRFCFLRSSTKLFLRTNLQLEKKNIFEKKNILGLIMGFSYRWILMFRLKQISISILNYHCSSFSILIYLFISCFKNYRKFITIFWIITLRWAWLCLVCLFAFLCLTYCGNYTNILFQNCSKIFVLAYLLRVTLNALGSLGLGFSLLKFSTNSWSSFLYA